MSPLVSVIVPTRNSGSTLAACLTSIRSQTHGQIELIVVDNNSTDETQQIGRELADVLLEAGPERSAQRNAGAQAAHGEFLVFIDSDMYLEAAVIAECVAAAAAGDQAVVIPEMSFGEGFWARCKALERSCYLGDETVEAARFYAREAFVAVGGYDEEIAAGPEDWDIHERVRAGGSTIGRSTSLIRHDEGRLSLRATMATKFYYGKATGTYVRKHPELARRQLRVVRPAFVRHRRRLARDPLVATGMLVMKVCELGAGAAGLIAATLAARPSRLSTAR